MERPSLLRGAAPPNVRALELYVDDAPPDALAVIAPDLPRMRLRELAVRLGQADLPAPLFAAFLDSPHLAGLEALVVGEATLLPAHLQALLASTVAPRLRSLGLRACRLHGETALALGQWPAGTLRALDLGHNRLGAGAVDRIIDEAAVAGLERLVLPFAGLGDDDLVGIAASELPLVELDFSGNVLDSPMANVIAGTAEFARLRRLGLAHTQIGAEGLAALLDSPHLSPELELALDGELLGLEPDIWYDQGMPVGSSWKGAPPARVVARFPRVVVEGAPSY